ncbi:alpha/beta-hydrolase [Aspergillus sclerotiicarbonarius CBS 121057]|uniref:Alpha/beta-hydrolase n=1 Tax=Aspergillus sclerotiicarbonarius (strain CBS 121057 / IBT 28362) TaxID=1448318 RepID=A0A319DY33_ASPSB|nr:alpha/beta-hydrolase [Aspergillus sclerotiicarbonarius CBS 121057]
MSLSPWLSGTHSGNVSIDGHRMFLSASGPERQVINGTLQPAVIIEAGLGSCHSEWVVVQRLIAERARVYSYDRAGYGRSENSPLAPTAQNRVSELSQLLDVAGIGPPYVLVGQSYGGVLIREFLHVHTKEKVAGMVIIDSWRAPNPLPRGWFTLMGEASFNAIVGLDANHRYSPDEYVTVNEDETRNAPTFSIEEPLVGESMARVNAEMPVDFPALGDGRLSVIFGNRSADFRKILEFGAAHGHGTVEARESLAARLEDMEQVDEEGQRAHLGLSSQSRFVLAQGKAQTHNVHYVAPEVIRDEVFWVMGLIESTG